MPGPIDSASRTVTTAGTRVRLTTTQTLVSSVSIKAKKANGGLIYIGGDDVSSTKPPLDAGDMLNITSDPRLQFDLREIWLDASVSGEGVDYWYFQQ